MIRRFNFTGRHRIGRELIELVAHRVPNQNIEIDFSLKMEEIQGRFPEIPGDGLILMEAYRGSEAWERVHCGTVENPNFPQRYELEMFGWEDAVLFRVKIVSSGEGPSKILAWNTQLKAEDSDAVGNRSRCLLPVEPRDDMGDRFWNLAWNEDVPVLQVNSRYGEPGSAKHIVQNDISFQTFVFPKIIEDIYHELLIRRCDEYDREEDASGWMLFARSVLKLREAPLLEEDSEASEGEINDWIDQAVEAFCRFRKTKLNFEAFDLNRNENDE